MKNTIKKVCMDREQIIKFIEDNVKSELVYYKIQKELIEVILKIIPLLGHYEEESKKLNFKIALGMNTDISKLVVTSYVLKRYVWNAEDTEESRIRKIEKMIKEVAIFCEKNADIFLIQNENEIECGVFFLGLINTDVTKDKLIKNNFIIFQHLYGNKVLAVAKDDTMCICMDFDQEAIPKNLKSVNIYEIDVCGKWEGIFDKVKRTVHGTICLIVDTNWDPRNDKNFTNCIETIDLDLRIKSKAGADDIQDFDNKLEMFLAMLNYDGITIIDTEERIRAYNLFCKVDSEGEAKVSGGARHKAYNSLKRLNPKQRYGYIAIYFQSQEGEVEFYRFSAIEDDEKENEILHFFDANVMYTKDAELNSRYKTIRERYDKIEKACIGEFENVEKEYLNTYYEVIQLVINLREAHNGFYNFYNEPGAVKELLIFIEKNREQVLEILKRYSKIRMDIVNIVFECIIGNGSGFSRNAQGDLIKIIQCLTEEVWKIYFENGEFLDTALLWEISSSFLYGRWKEILEHLKKVYPNIKETISEKEFDQKDYLIMYNALAINLE